MEKARAQHNSQPQNQSTVQQNIGKTVESSQGEQMIQLETMAKSGLQARELAQLKTMIAKSPKITAQRQLRNMIHNSSRQATQRRFSKNINNNTIVTTQQVKESVKPNDTGLPNNLKTGIESLSGMSLDNVKVHYNSSQPAQLNALAFAQGTNIHIAPGQEQHLPHEAWHVVQQAQGRVQPTMHMKDGALVKNDGDRSVFDEIKMLQGASTHALIQRMAPTTAPQHTPVPQGTKTQVWPEYSGNFSRNSNGTGGNLNRIGGLEAVIPRNNTAGSSPNADPLGWRWLYTMMPKVKGNWVRFHILNAGLGGDGNDTDLLIPTTHSDNTGSWLHTFETGIKQSAATAALHYRIEIDYFGIGATGNNETDYNKQFFPQSLRAAYRTWDSMNNSWSIAATNNGSILANISPPPTVAGTVQRDIESVSEKALLRIWGISSKLAQLIIRTRNNVGFVTVNSCQGLCDLLMDNLFTTSSHMQYAIDNQFEEESEAFFNDWPRLQAAVTATAGAQLLVNHAPLPVPGGQIHRKSFEPTSLLRKSANSITSVFSGLPFHVATAINALKKNDFVEETDLFDIYIRQHHITNYDGGAGRVLSEWRNWMNILSIGLKSLPIHLAASDPANAWRLNLMSKAIVTAKTEIKNPEHWENLGDLDPAMQANLDDLTTQNTEAKLKKIHPTDLEKRLTSEALKVVEYWGTRRHFSNEAKKLMIDWDNRVKKFLDTKPINAAQIDQSWGKTLEVLSHLLQEIRSMPIRYPPDGLSGKLENFKAVGKKFFND
ncbi:DUF4157 domain-containing protein [Nitrosomonas sp.]|uniref:eCIS core domain-containing protein n=1 Tax=Nitrosomonas sp. TaxID=42353 RepID=UPI0032EF743B